MSVHLPTELPGCVLRPWHPADKADLVRHANNRNVWRNMAHSFPHPYTEEDADLWLAIAAEPGRSLQLAIEVDGQPVGGIGAIAGEGVFAATAEFGYWLGEPWWGRGIATAAARALASRILDERLFARLQAHVFAWNAASMRVLEKAGFAREAVLRCAATKEGQLIDAVLYARLWADAGENDRPRS